MTLSQVWVELHATRFPELPLDCGNEVDPGVIYSEDLRDWSGKATTPDQYRIERYIDRFDLRDKRILHIGIGNSGLARRFHKRTGKIVGTTIDDPEIDVARSLNLPNYEVLKQNKYSAANEDAAGKFDFIIDNNPTSPCCCIRHLAALLSYYDSRLADNGQIVTDQEGLGWVPDGSSRRWSFSFDDLAAVAGATGLFAHRMNGNVYVLARSTLERPSRLALFRHALRRARSAPVRALGGASRALRRLVRVAFPPAASE